MYISAIAGFVLCYNLYIMKKIKSILFSSAVFLAAALLIIVSAQYGIKPESVDAQAQPVPPPKKVKLTGYAWSENIGWISFRDGLVPVEVKPNGDLVGYAWSEHIGWVQFGNLGQVPNSAYGGDAKLNGTTITGWARAVAGASGGVNTGIWDGWIALNGARIQPPFVATPSNSFPPFISGCTSGGCTNGAAWGSHVVGWVDFSGVATMQEGLACIGPDGESIPDGSGLMYSKTEGGECFSGFRACNNGTLEGDATFTDPGSCDDDYVAPKANCVRAGKTYLHGTKVSFYSKAIAGINQTCESFKAELTCDNGKFYDSNGNEDTGGTFKILKCINNPNFKEQ